MTLMHYAAAPITFDRGRTYTQEEPHAYGKPAGLWVSVAGEDDWPSWCRKEEFAQDSLAAVHSVTLAESAEVHTITSAFELDAFTGLYAVQTDRERKFTWTANDQRHWPIDWRRVAEDCNGLIIAPYQWARRLELDWYYGWDCASGCIWNLDAIESVVLVDSEVLA